MEAFSSQFLPKEESERRSSEREPRMRTDEGPAVERAGGGVKARDAVYKEATGKICHQFFDNSHYIRNGALLCCPGFSGVGGHESAGGNAQDDLKYFEREVVAELAAQILRVAQGPSAFVAGPHKRNSELINSLLGLPKVMNDAGRR
ncbi:Pigment-dispersing hormone type 2 [Penaeus vannamei]|uniref:Pigment-dispersing hormone type 2 n=1 Tax=Penaeus vannamei TaxID=6689 RepID=A0A3R7QBP0_PENVA|nr:Pigment-dispersing hormone type 2 [Penaeus vannamei]